MTEDRYHDVVVVGVDRAETRLARAGITDVAVVDACDLSGALFDEASHTWVLPTCRARIVVTDQTRSGREDLAPYLGVAVHGAPNYFMVTGADAVAEARLDFIAECLTLMRRTGSTRIEVLFSTQRMFAIRGADKADRADASYWQRMAKSGADVVRPEFAHRCRRRDLRRRRDDPRRRRRAPGAGATVRAPRPHRRPIPLAGNDFRRTARRGADAAATGDTDDRRSHRRVSSHRAHAAGPVFGGRRRRAALRARPDPCGHILVRLSR